MANSGTAEFTPGERDRINDLLKLKLQTEDVSFRPQAGVRDSLQTNGRCSAICGLLPFIQRMDIAVYVYYDPRRCGHMTPETAFTGGAVPYIEGWKVNISRLGAQS